MEKTGRMKGIMHTERGFVLATTLWILLILVFIGIGAISRSNTELLIAGNEKFHQMTLYQADGGLAAAEQILEENLSCANGFTATNPPDTGSDALIGGRIDGGARVDGVWVTNLILWMNNQLPLTTVASSTDRDFYFPNHRVPNVNDDITYVRTGGETVPAEGGSLQMAAGYMGKGKSFAGGGAYLLYDIFVQHRGQAGTSTDIWGRWRHMVGQEGPCNY
jgi:hypothetical protein